MKSYSIFLAALCLSFSVALAQSTYGTITGRVTDPSSAAVAGAKVEATNQETRIAHAVETNTEGLFRFVNLDPGTYTISTSVQGFIPAEQTAIKLEARDELTINLQLALAGGARTTVEVVGTPVTSLDLTRTDSKSGDVINSLALNFRASASPSPIVVTNLAPGAQSDSSGNITIAGQLPTATSYSLDGVSTQLHARFVSICGGHL